MLVAAGLSFTTQAFAGGIDDTQTMTATAAVETDDDFWVTGWYAGWYQNDMPPSKIDFSIVTHLMHFMIVPRTDGSLEVSTRPGFETPQRIAEVVNTTHAAGRKVLITVGGAGSYNGFKAAIQPANRARFVQNLAGFVRTHNYDGVDVDMEPINPDDYTNFKAFANELHTALNAISPDKLMTVAAGPAGAICSIQGLFDQINIMTYDMSGAWGGWVTWHNAPIHNGGTKFPSVNRYLPSADLYAQEFIDAGCASSKIATGLDFYGYVWSGGSGTDTGGVTKPLQSWNTPPSVASNVPYFDLVRSYNVNSAKWDGMAHAAYIGVDQPGSAGDRFVSFDNEQTAFAKVQYARERGHGGIAIWELAGGYLRDASAPVRDPLLQAVGDALRGSAPLPTPTPSATPTATPTVAPTATPQPTVQPTAQPTPTATVAPTAQPTAQPTEEPSTLPTATPGPVSGESIVTSGAAAGAWMDISWGVSNSQGSNEQQYLGKPSFRSQGGGAVAFRNGPWHQGIAVNPADYESFEFAVHPGNKTLKLTVAGGNDSDGWFASTSGGTVPAGKWTVIELPMSALSPNGKPVHKFYIGHDGGGATVVHFGSIVAEREGSAPTPAPTPVPTATPAPTASPTATPAPTATPTPAPAELLDVFADSVVSPWMDISWGVSNSTVATTQSGDGFSVAPTLLVSRGSGALSFRHGPWHQGIAIQSSVKSLTFLARTNASLKLVVGAGNDAQGWFAPIEVDTVPAGQWRLIEVPISQVNPSGAVMHKFYIGPKGGSSTTELQFQTIGFGLAQ